MGTIRIRRVLRQDLDTVYRIEKQSFTDYYPRTFLSYLYDVHRSTFLVAEKEKAVVGYVIAAATRDLGRIISIAVHPSERKKAVGSSIMREVLKILQGNLGK